MALESVMTRRTWQANGETKEWPVSFAYSRAEDLRLIHTDAAGVETPISSNFRVNENEAGNASITFPLTGPPLPAGVRLTVYRQTPLTQIIDLIYGGAFAPDVLEKDGFDRIVMMIQELDEVLARTIKVPFTLDISPDELLARIFAAEAAAGAAAGSAQNALRECRELVSIIPEPTDADVSKVLLVGMVNGKPRYVLVGAGFGGGGGMAEQVIPVTDASGRVTVNLMAMGLPAMPGPFNPVINLLSVKPYTYCIISRSAEEFTVQIYKPGGVAGVEISLFIECGEDDFEAGDFIECGESGWGADVQLVVGIPLGGLDGNGGGGSGEGEGVSAHNQLTDRNAENCHPISAISGLASALENVGQGGSGGGATMQPFEVLTPALTGIPVAAAGGQAVPLMAATVDHLEHYLTVIDMNGVTEQAQSQLPAPLRYCIVLSAGQAVGAGERVLLFDNKNNDTPCAVYFDKAYFNQHFLDFATTNTNALIEAIRDNYLFIRPNAELMVRLTASGGAANGIDLFPLRTTPTDATMDTYGTSDNTGALQPNAKGSQLAASAFSVWKISRESQTQESLYGTQILLQPIDHTYLKLVLDHAYPGTQTILFKRLQEDGTYKALSRIVITSEGDWSAPENLTAYWQGAELDGTFADTGTRRDLVVQGADGAEFTAWARQLSLYPENDQHELLLDLTRDPNKQHTGDTTVTEILFDPEQGQENFRSEFVRVKNFATIQKEFKKQQELLGESVVFIESLITEGVLYDQALFAGLQFHKGVLVDVDNMVEARGKHQNVKFGFRKTAPGTGPFDVDVAWGLVPQETDAWKYVEDRVPPSGIRLEPFEPWSSVVSGAPGTFYIRLRGISYYYVRPIVWAPEFLDALLEHPLNPPEPFRIMTDAPGRGKFAHIFHSNGGESWFRLDDAKKNIFMPRFMERAILFKIRNKLTFPTMGPHTDGCHFEPGDYFNYNSRSFVATAAHDWNYETDHNPADPWALDASWASVDADYFGVTDGGDWITSYDEDSPPVLESVYSGTASFGTKRIMLRNGFAFVSLNDFVITPSDLAYIDKYTRTPALLDNGSHIRALYPLVPMWGWPESTEHDNWHQWTVKTNTDYYLWEADTVLSAGLLETITDDIAALQAKVAALETLPAECRQAQEQ